MDGAALPIAGWYPDPAGSAELRWWDGSVWTAHLRERTPAPAPAVQPVSYASTYAPTYVPMERSEASYRPAVAETDPYAEVKSSTTAVWVIALYQLPYTAVVLIVLYSLGLPGLPVISGLGLVVFLLIWGMAMWDHSALEKRGIQASSVLWMFLTPIGYLIARRVRLKSLGIPANAPGNAFAIVFVAALLASYASLVPVRTSVEAKLAIVNVETQAAVALEKQTSTYWTVKCPTDAPVETPGAVFGCQASDTAGHTGTLRATVIAPEQFRLSFVPVTSTTTNS